MFLSTPLLLAFTQGRAAVEKSNIVLHQMQGLFALPGTTLAVFALTALAGYGLARLARLPMPHLLGPLGLSLILHVSGLLDVPRISEFVILAQVSIGGAVGARLSKVPFRDVFVYIADALVSAVILLLVYALARPGCIFCLAWICSACGWLLCQAGCMRSRCWPCCLVDVAFVAVHVPSGLYLLFCPCR